ncbi:hypothetical protein E2562_022429 [Oryza meyeriana var. granulata]|uniref:F-box domain-containing protein n=1 Tax=Oryza meyeriana var. granulata TaxID=110450 RepID=A0A6G1BMA1_9ORYZ|nr:hypothetical protein E2562_022429 [Oryza meyeriana var. granulata]
MASSATLPPPAVSRDWAALQRDLLLSVLAAAGHEEILRGARLACSAWYRAARDEPALWRRIEQHGEAAAPDDDDEYAPLDRFRLSLFDVSKPDPDDYDPKGWKAMPRAAVDRSAGQCVAFSGRANDKLLLYLADNFTKSVILSILNSCPNLRLLDISNVAYLKMDEELRMKCLKIKDLCLPPEGSSESDDVLQQRRRRGGQRRLGDEDCDNCDDEGTSDLETYGSTIGRGGSTAGGLGSTPCLLPLLLPTMDGM